MKLIGFVLVIFLSINVGVLYYIVLFGDVPEFSRRLDILERRVDSLIQMNKSTTKLEPSVQADGSLVVLSDQQNQEIAQVVKDSIQTDIDLALAEFNKQLTTTTQAATSVQKEFFIPIGDATIKTSDNQWKDIPLELEFDRSQYGNVTQVVLETTLKVPTANGQVYVRLWDSTAGAVGNSELAGEGSSGVFIRSQPLAIAAGRRTLKVQMKTSLDYEGQMENARLRIRIE